MDFLSEIAHNQTTWVTVSFFLFIATLFYLKVPGMITKVLDDRAEGIAAQLDQARRLREDAQANLAAYQRKQRDAEGEAQGILDHAKAEALRTAADAEAALEATITRREAQAQDKIAQAEAAAVKQVRNAAVVVATEAARNLIAESLSSDRADQLTDQSITDIDKHIN